MLDGLSRWGLLWCLGCSAQGASPVTTPRQSESSVDAASESHRTASATEAQASSAPSHDAGASDPSQSSLAPARFESLQVPGFLDAVVSLPSSSRPEPVVVATHGAGCAPEHHCLAWRALLGQRGIVLCPRGAMINRRYGAAGGFYYPNHHVLEQELLATLKSFEANYAGRALSDSYVYSGYSQGASMGALLLPRHAKTFPRAVLIEGGFNEWDLRAAKTFREQGGERVAFICGGGGCKRAADRSASILERAEVLVVTKHAVGSGHTYLGGVAEQTADTFPWLVKGDASWLD